MKTHSRVSPAFLLAVAICGCSDPQGVKAAQATEGNRPLNAGRIASSVPNDQGIEVDGKPRAVPVSRFPSCEHIKKALGPAAAALVELPETENGPYKDRYDEGVSCGWVTKQMKNGSLELDQYGGLAIGVTKMGRPYVEADMRQSGFVIADTRAASIGAYVLSLDGNDFNPEDQLGPTGVQVIIGDTAVVLTSSGLVLQNNVPELAGLTNDWAIGAGVNVWKLMK